MGACCKLFAKRKQEAPPEEENKQTELLAARQPLSPQHRTSNDAQFTYFLDVFELSSVGASLKRPEFADEAHPLFNYQQFHQLHREYYRLVRQLGLYVERRKNPTEPLNQRIEKDRIKIEEGRKALRMQESKQVGCLVKLEIQGAAGQGVDQIVISHHHPQSGKFKQTISLKDLRARPVFVEFVVPEVASSWLRIIGNPRGLQAEVELESSLEKGKIVFCEVLRWGGEQGVAVRMQLFEGKDQGERLKEMGELYSALIKEFQNRAPEADQPTKEEIGERVSRHRSSLNHHYNLNNNSMF